MTYKELYDYLHEAVKDDDVRADIERDLELEIGDGTYKPRKYVFEYKDVAGMIEVIGELSGWELVDDGGTDYVFVGKDTEQISDKVVKQRIKDAIIIAGS